MPTSRTRRAQDSARMTKQQRSQATPARRAALDLVSQVRKEGVYLSQASVLLDARDDLDRSERAFAFLLAHGVLSLQVTLDQMIDKVLRSPRDVKPRVRDALRISAYEILYLHKQDHAAVDQGVELVRTLAPRASGVANFVLRRIVEEKERFPYGDPTTSLGAAELFYGFPVWLSSALDEELASETIPFMASSIEPAPIWFCANELLLSSDALAQKLEAAGIEYSTCDSLIARASSSDPSLGIEPAIPSAIFRLADRSDVSSEAFSRLLASDAVIVSDLSAQSIVRRTLDLLALLGSNLETAEHDSASFTSPALRMLEIGAGRGTKTLQFLSGIEDRGIALGAYHAMDLSKGKISELERRIEAAGGSLDAAIAHDATTPFPSDELYDLIFVDAPCSGLGTLRRHPELKARLEPADSGELANIGEAIIEQASSHLAPGGFLVYATCTVLSQENEQVIERFLDSEAGSSFELVPFASEQTFFKTPFEPHGADLHFAALLRKKSLRPDEVLGASR